MEGSNSKKTAFLIAIGLIGSAAITSQILLIREIINLFSGNELIYGLTIFLWLILYAAGSGLLGRLAHKINTRLNIFIALQILIAALLPAEIYLSRIIKNLLGIPFGSIVNFPQTILIIIILLAPITLILGFQFSLGSLVLSEHFKKESSQVSRVYIAESIGSIAGGLFLTYILVFFLNAFQIAALLALLISLSLLLLSIRKPANELRGFLMIWKPRRLVSGFLVLASIILFINSSYLNKISTEQTLGIFQLAEVADSPYGRITVSEYYGSYNFYENGGLFFSTADYLSNEETAHLSLLLHSNPKKVLLIGGAATGIVNELLKYPLEQLDVLELDHKIITLAKNFVNIDPKANIIAQDGVRFIAKTKNTYDVIIINLPNPSTTLINRFYTKEFFKKCKAKLSKAGIMTFHLETSESYMGRELKLLNRSIYKTVSQVFNHTSIIPGNHNYFFASQAKLTDNRYDLLDRWEKRNIKTLYFRSNSLYYILWPDKLDYIKQAIAFDENTPINTELKPVSYFYELLIWTSYFYASPKDFFYQLLTFKFKHFLLTILMILLIVYVITKRNKALTIPTIICLIGFSGMTTQLIIIYTFQSLYGYVYQAIGLLTTAFMAGLTLGSILVYKKYNEIENPEKILKYILLALILLLSLLLAALKYFPLPLASLLISLPIGAAFPLAVKIHEKHKSEIGSLAGVLYGADLLGGALAAIVTTIFFVPIFGIVNTLLIAVILAGAALAISYS